LLIFNKGFFVLSGNNFNKNLHIGNNTRIFYVAPSKKKQNFFYYENKKLAILYKENDDYSFSLQNDFKTIKIIEFVESNENNDGVLKKEILLIKSNI
jgi:hypothetical protein